MIESNYLKADQRNIDQLAGIPDLKNFTTAHLGALLRQSKIRQYEHGETIIREGDRDPWFYFLLAGRVKVFKRDEEISSIDRRGEILGEMSVLDGSARSATIRSEGKVMCLAVDTSASNRAVSKAERGEQMLVMYRLLLDRMLRRLRQRTADLAAAREDNQRLREEVSRLKLALETARP